MTLVLTDTAIPGGTTVNAVVRLIENPVPTEAVFAISVDRHLAGRGVGTNLVRRVLDYRSERVVTEVFGDVLPDIQRMLKLCRKQGFLFARENAEPGVIRIAMALKQKNN